MAASVTHAKVATIADDSSAKARGEVVLSDWNAGHVLTGIRNLSTSNLTLNVATTGNDITGDGSAGKPFATPQAAYNYAINNLDTAVSQITIKLADGTYIAQNGYAVLADNTAAGSAIPCVNFNLTVLGNLGTPANVVFDFSAGTLGVGFFTSTVNAIGGFIIKSTGSGTCLDIQSGEVYTVGPMVFGTCPGGHHIHVSNGGRFVVFSPNNYSITGGASTHLNGDNGLIDIENVTVTLTSTPAFSDAFLSVHGGLAFLIGVTFSGSATGGHVDLEVGSRVLYSDSSFNFLPLSTLPGNSFGFTDGSGSTFNGAVAAASGAGLPSTSIFQDPGFGGVYKDTSGGGVYLAYNDGGVIKSVAITTH